MKKKGNVFAKSTIILLVFILFFSSLTTFTKSATLNELTSGVGGNTNDRFGWNVSYAGDLNGDGYDDIAVGAPYAAAGGIARGAVYIFFGYSGIDTSNINATNANVTINGLTDNAHFGWSVSNAGDVNQTSGGIDDLIIGEPDNGNGKAYIFFGRSSWLSPYTTANANVILTGEASGDKFGSSVSGAGDVNNDGYDDVIVGAYANGTDKGKAYIYYGPPVDETNYVDSFDETSSGRYGTTNNFVNAQSATGAYATLTEELTPKLPAFCSYRSNTGANLLNSPKNHDWDGSVWSSPEEMPTTGSPVRFVRTAYSPVESRRYEIIVVTLSDDGYLDAYVWTGSAWSVTDNIARVWTTAPTGAQRPYDITYETSSGRALLVYDVILADATKDLGYKIWTGAGWSAEYYIDVTGVVSTNPSILFVNLASNPDTSSNQIAMVIQDDTNADTFAGIWSGSAWELFTTLSTAYTIVGREATAIAYSTYYKKILAVSGNGANSLAWKWYVQGAGSWTAGTAFDPDPDAGNDVCFITLKPDPAATSTDDYIMYAGVNDLSDLNAWAWDMADATPGRYNIVNEVDEAIDSATARCIDFAWEPTGNKGLIVWGTTSGVIHYNTYSISAGWGASWTTNVAMVGGIHPWVQLRTNPRAITGDVKILGAVLTATVFDLGAIQWDGTTFTVIGVSTFTADTTVITFECFELEFQAVPEGYSLDIEFTTISVQSATNYELQLNYRTDVATSENFGVLVYNGATWDDLSAQGDLIATTTMTAKTYTLSSTHQLVDGSVRVRFVGRSERNDGTQNQLWIEYHRIRSFGMVGSVTLTGENSGDKFGFSVSSAGNVNGDSYDDVIVGAPGYDNNRGKAYVVYGYSQMVSTLKILFSDGFESGNFVAGGWTVSTDPQVNTTNVNTGTYSVNLGAGNTVTTNAITKALDTTGMTGIKLYYSVATEGLDAGEDYFRVEYNTGTGFVELPGSNLSSTNAYSNKSFDLPYAADNNPDLRIRFYLYRSATFEYAFVDDVRVTGISRAAPNVTIIGESPNDIFGYSVSSLGNVNNDGYDDFAVGAPGYDNSRGRVYIYYGSNNLLSGVLTIQQQSDVKDTYILSDNATSNRGSLSEFYVGYCTDAGYLKERALIQFNVSNIPTSANILKADMKLYLRNSGGIIDTTFQIPAYRVTPPASNEWTESGVTWNTYDGTNNWATAGLGSGTDYASTPVASTSVDTAVTWYTWDIKQVTQDWVNNTYPNRGLVLLNTTIEGNAANDDKWFYSSEHIGYYYWPKLEIEYIYANITLTGTQPGDKFGYSVSGGNITGDSYNDIVVGAPYNDTAGSNAGAIYIFNGSASMPSSISALDANYTNYGENTNDNFGFSVSSAGDVNNDNYDDVVVGAPYYGTGDNGKVYVLTTVALINNPPSVTNLGVQGFVYGKPGLGNITNHTPKLNWTYSDPNGDPQGGYNVTVWNVTAIMWYINSPGTDTNVTYGVGGSSSLPLADGFDYNFTVKVNDSKGAWSVLSYLVFHMNSVPPTPGPISPSNNSEQPEAPTITVSWNSVADIEGITITYLCKIYKPYPDNLDNQTYTTNTFFEFSVSPGTYEWWVQANDSYENSSWSDRWKFNVVSGNVAPNPINLGVQGYMGSTSEILNITNHTPVLNYTYTDTNGDAQSWRNVSVYNITSGKVIWYKNGSNPQSSGSNVAVTYNDDSTATAALQDGCDYYFNVTCNDTNATSKWSNVVSVKFHMNTPPPTPTTPIIPTNGETGISTTTALNWTAVTDPEGSDITYYWYIDDNEDFSSLFNSGFTPLNTNTSGALSLLSGTKYYWRVRAWDGYKYGENSTIWNFTTIAGNNPPDPPTLTGPENNTWNNSATINFTWSYFDPEGNPQNGFNITISNNSDFSVINWTLNETSSNHYKKLTLSNGTWYWKVKVNDTNHAWSKWSEWRIIKIDTGKPESDVDDISIYWHKEPVEITANSTDDNWVKNVTLYYYYSADNSSWDATYIFGTNDTLNKINSNWTASWLFDFPKGEGYYRFYSAATDNASNTEDPPTVNDTKCGYDKTSPSISPLNPDEGSLARSKTVNISAVLNDVVSGIKWSSVNVTRDGGTTNLWVENNKTKVEGGWKIWVDLSFSDGSHTVKVEIKSNASNTGIKTWSFTVDSSPITVDSIRFSHYIGRVGQTITIYVEVYNNGSTSVGWYVNITDEFGKVILDNGSISISGYSTASTSALYTIPLDADGKTITFTVKIYNETGKEIDYLPAYFDVASSFAGAKPVKSFDISLPIIFLAAVFAALLSLKGRHKRRKQS